MEQLSLIGPDPGAAAPSPRGGDPDGLRLFQRHAIDGGDGYPGVRQSLRDYMSTLLIMATGLGKTITFSVVAKHWPGRVLCVAERDAIVEQTQRTMAAVTGEVVGREQAGWYAGAERIVVGTVQTLKNARRLRRFEKRPFDLIIFDEGHHAIAKSYRDVRAAFGQAKVLGATATPDRGDGRAMRLMFESVAYRRDIDDGIDDGYLVPALLKSVFVRELDVSGVKSAAGDLVDGELDEALMAAVAPIARVVHESCGDRKTPGVRTAHAVAEALNHLRPNSARAADGSMDAVDKRRTLEAHKRGEYQYLANCALYTEGYDDPTLSCVVIARMTKSRGRYAQMAGRGLRPLPGVVDGLWFDHASGRRAAIHVSAKPDMLLIDIAGNAGRHQLVSPIDVLGGRMTDAERAVAKKKLEAGEFEPMDRLELQAREAVKDEARKRAAIAATKAKLSYDLIQVDPFAALGARPPTQRELSGDPAEPYQLKALRRLGVEFAGPLTRAMATKLYRTAKMRKAKGLCDQRQVRWLARHGVDGRRMYAATGQQIADAYRAAGRTMPPAPVLEAIIKGPDAVQSQQSN